MREIKFRAITQEGVIVHDVGSIQFYTDGTILVNDEIPVKRLLQCTGLRDKDGKEIYEADIVRAYSKRGGEMREDQGPSEISFYRGAFIRLWGEAHVPLFFGPRDQVFEVIGNAYENPNLLKARP